MNKVIITNARLVRNPELKFAAGSGKAITKFTLAVSRQFKKDESDFINCIIFDKQAETIAQYFQKGDPINIEGSIQTGSYENKEGKKVYTTDIIVRSFEFVNGGKKNNDNKQTNQNSFDDLMEVEDDGDLPF